jgi:hypothetical protein
MYVSFPHKMIFQHDGKPVIPLVIREISVKRHSSLTLKSAARADRVFCLDNDDRELEGIPAILKRIKDMYLTRSLSLTSNNRNLIGWVEN